ncbi:clarin-3 isoform X2 [Anabrus simplex]|uniref:clarin-3 isoform X2 n=1 Tax=Anabrus simplex TaxID=316456 RepID=UPI0035A293D9
MATTKRQYVFGSFILSCIALALLITSMATQEWVMSDLKLPRDNSTTGSVNYGLFTGRFERIVLQMKFVFTITLTCVMEDNICGWSCLGTAEEREKDIKDLYDSGNSSAICAYIESEPLVGVRRLKMGRAGDDTDVENVPDKQFVNAGLWVSTVLFLVLALVITGASSLLAVLNAATNPSRTCLAMDGLYFWNGAAAFLDLLVLILWGSQFAVTLTDNVAVADVIKGDYTSSGLASLGYSYWLVFVSLLLSLASVAVLAVRDYLLSREPPPPAFNPDISAKDGTIFLY